LNKLGVSIDTLMFPTFLLPFQPFAKDFLKEFAYRDKELKGIKKKFGRTGKEVAERSIKTSTNI
jgi:hypothetical protein